MIFKRFIFCFYIVFTSGCGFQLATYNSNYNLVQINTSGDKKINYLLRNKISNTSKKNSENLVELELNSKINKSIKEKNIKNQINKYEIKIITFVKYNSLRNEKKGNFTISKSADFSISKKYSETLRNEKKTIETIVNLIADEIINNLEINLSDS